MLHALTTEQSEVLAYNSNSSGQSMHLVDPSPVLYATFLPPVLQTVDRTGLGVSWGVPFIVAAVAMIVAGIVIGFMTIKGELSS